MLIAESRTRAYLASIVPVIVNTVLNEHQLVLDIVAFVSRGDFPRSRLGEKQRGKILASWVSRRMQTIAQFSIRDPETDGSVDTTVPEDVIARRVSAQSTGAGGINRNSPGSVTRGSVTGRSSLRHVESVSQMPDEAQIIPERTISGHEEDDEQGDNTPVRATHPDKFAGAYHSGSGQAGKEAESRQYSLDAGPVSDDDLDFDEGHGIPDARYHIRHEDQPAPLHFQINDRRSILASPNAASLEYSPIDGNAFESPAAVQVDEPDWPMNQYASTPAHNSGQVSNGSAFGGPVGIAMGSPPVPHAAYSTRQHQGLAPEAAHAGALPPPTGQSHVSSTGSTILPDSDMTMLGGEYNETQHRLAFSDDGDYEDHDYGHYGGRAAATSASGGGAGGGLRIANRGDADQSSDDDGDWGQSVLGEVEKRYR